MQIPGSHTPDGTLAQNGRGAADPGQPMRKYTTAVPTSRGLVEVDVTETVWHSPKGPVPTWIVGASGWVLDDPQARQVLDSIRSGRRSELASLN